MRWAQREDPWAFFVALPDRKEVRITSVIRRPENSGNGIGMKNDECTILRELIDGQGLEWPEKPAERSDLKQQLDTMKDEGLVNVTYTSIGSSEDVKNIAYVSVSLTPEGRLTGEDEC
ncbi:MAG: hypothetical protein Q3M24_10100 [Candidatus Electrothrix aestuarii]|uniref:Uncharacterized protein n=1 Tax=Candidatus Electrothrix aestuarii TaxID=3062594 RepID=A0AAU8M0P1_9BACT|nr:hypothetical protein [Candidatus Electrothrix aestuarii]